MGKQKFQGKTVYTKRCVDNIINAWNQSTASRDWYRDAHSFGIDLYLMYETSIVKIFGIIAALSPQKSWIENKRLAKAFLSGNESGHTRVNLNKARRILDLSTSNKEDVLDILNGEKTKAFFLNMLEPNTVNGVTIDRHAVEIAVGKVLPNHKMTVRQYQFFERCYFIAANKIGILPHELQAVTWEYWREYKKTV